VFSKHGVYGIDNLPEKQKTPQGEFFAMGTTTTCAPGKSQVGTISKRCLKSLVRPHRPLRLLAALNVCLIGTHVICVPTPQLYHEISLVKIKLLLPTVNINIVHNTFLSGSVFH